MTDHSKEVPGQDGKDEGQGRSHAIAAGGALGVGIGIGAAVYAATNDPIWIAIGTALGAGFGWVSSR